MAADLNRSGMTPPNRLGGGTGGGGGMMPPPGTWRMAIRDRGAMSPNMFIAPCGSLRPPPRPDAIPGAPVSAAPGWAAGCDMSGVDGCPVSGDVGWPVPGTAERCCGYGSPGCGGASPVTVVDGAPTIGPVGIAGVTVTVAGQEWPGGTKIVICETGCPQRWQDPERRPNQGQSMASAELAVESARSPVPRTRCVFRRFRMGLRPSAAGDTGLLAIPQIRPDRGGRTRTGRPGH